MHGVRYAEGGPAMSTRTAIRDVIAPRAECLVDDALVTGAVERDRGRGLVRQMREQVLRAAKVACAFLPGRRDEHDRATRSQPATVHLLGDRQHCREPAPIVA